MTPVFSKTKFSTYIDAYVKRSKQLDRIHYFNHDDIAKAVFGKQDKYAAQHFSAARSPTNQAPLRQRFVTDGIAACRALLREQHQRMGIRNGDAAVAQFEEELCRTLRIGGEGQATCDDFRVVSLIESATTVQEFGVPDVLEWSRGTFDFAGDLKALQRRSIDALRSIRDWMAFCADDRRRLQLAYVAVNASMLNHPGSPWHDDAFDLAMQIACLAQVPRFATARNVPDDLKEQAIRLDHQMLWNRILPTLDSPSNYMTYALSGRAMPSHVWHEVRHALAASIVGVRRHLELDPTNQRVTKHLTSALSMQARMMLVTGNTGDLAEAERLSKESLRFMENVSVPYAFAFPILKDIVQSKYRRALAKIEAAMSAFEQGGVTQSVAGFAALHVQVTHLLGKSSRSASRPAPTNDSHIRKLAARAVASPGIRYQHSHVFDASIVRRLLYPNAHRADGPLSSGASES